MDISGQPVGSTFSGQESERSCLLKMEPIVCPET